MNKLSNIVEGSYILTKDGYKLIEDTIGNNIIWNGYTWKEVVISKNNNLIEKNNTSPDCYKTVRLEGNTWKDEIVYRNNTNESKEKNNTQYVYYKIIISDGCEVICHYDQKLYIVENMSSNIYKAKPINEIKENTLIYKYSFPLLDGNNNEDILFPYYTGYLAGNIYNVNNKAESALLTEDEIIKLFDNTNDVSEGENFKVLDNIIKTLLEIDPKNIVVPINASKDNKLLWISGLIEQNACIINIKDGIYLNIIVSSKEFSMKVKYLFNTLGTNPKIIENTEIRKIAYVNINRIEKKEENNTIRYNLLFNAEDTNKIFLDYDIKTYFFKYDKSQYSLDQDINRYLSIIKKYKIEYEKKTFNINNTYSCIINGTLL